MYYARMQEYTVYGFGKNVQDYIIIAKSRKYNRRWDLFIKALSNMSGKIFCGSKPHFKDFQIFFQFFLRRNFN